MRTIVYVDGFNLFYGSLKGTPYKWLDMQRLFTEMLQPHHNIIKVKYFTARLSTKMRPEKAARQRVYLGAITNCCENLEIYYGHFLTQTRVARLADPIFGRKTAKIISTEEKGTDVNLASHLLDDGWRNNFDCAVIVSNDSDFSEAIRLVKRLDGKQIGIFFPFRKNKTRRSKQLLGLADFNRDVRENALRRCQLPEKIPGSSIFKPSKWNY